MKLGLLALVLVFVVGTVAAQDSVYLPGKTYTWKSKPLLSRLKEQLQNELKRNGLTEEMALTKQYQKLHEELQKQVEDSLFLDHRETQWLLDHTYLRLRDANPYKLQAPKTFLAYRYPLPNAYCVGEGTTLVTTGLLSRLENESQLAAVLAHELAHYELNHVYKRLVLQEHYEANKGKRTRPVTGDPVVDKAREQQQRVANLFEAYRKWELEADSLGFVYFSDAGFRQSEYLTMLTLFDPEGTSVDKTTSSFFAPLNFAQYPFNEVWLKPRAGIYGKSPWEFFLPADLTRTHPELVTRAGEIMPRVESRGEVGFIQPSSIGQVRFAAHIESMLAASKMPTLDLALYETLLSLNELPHNPYGVTVMGRLLLRLNSVMKDNLLSYYQPARTTGYDARMKLANNFINNVSDQEIVELGYHFMNQKENFHAEVEEHYYLLWQFCQLTGRQGTMKAVREEYLGKYPKGQYRKRMKDG